MFILKKLMQTLLCGRYTDDMTTATQPMPRMYSAPQSNYIQHLIEKLFVCQAKCLQAPQTWDQMLGNGTLPSVAWTPEVAIT